jgi:hypothetical protein
VQEPSKGRHVRSILWYGARTRPSGSRLTLWGAGGVGFAGTAKRVRGGGAKSQPRLSPENPRRGKPRGGSSGQQAKHLSGRQEFSEGLKPRNRGLSGRPGATVAGTPLGQTVCGSFGAETSRIPSERENLRRVNPMSAAGVKKNRHGIEGSKPSGG